ncbi:MAG: helix-turn-helix transcriptional regulator [Burkholderiales bacterium]|nr:helix-turn-helix transcriptional regulator [Burkholderiales bacterium]
MYESQLNEVKGRLSKNIKSLRKMKNLAQEKLALEAGVDRTVVSKIERMVANPSLEIIVRLAITLNVPPSQLIS